MKAMMFLISIFVLSTSYAQKTKFAVAPGELSHLEIGFVIETYNPLPYYDSATGEATGIKPEDRRGYKIQESMFAKRGYPTAIKKQSNIVFSTGAKNTFFFRTLFSDGIKKGGDLGTQEQEFKIMADKSLKNSTMRAALEILKNPNTKRIHFHEGSHDLKSSVVKISDLSTIKLVFELEGRIITITLEELLNRIESQGWTHDCHIEDLFGFDYNQAKGF